MGEDTGLRITELCNAEAVARSKTEEAIWLASLIRELSKEPNPDAETSALLAQYQARAISLLGMKKREVELQQQGVGRDRAAQGNQGPGY